MIIEGHSQLGQPFKIQASRVLVYDDFGNIVAAIVRYSKDSMYIGRLGEPGFEDYLQALGLKNVEVVDVVDIKKLNTLK